MNKNTIGYYLLTLSLGFILGFIVSQYSKVNFYGERDSVIQLENKKEESKIDSLENKNTLIDSRKKSIEYKRQKNYEEYIQDTTNLSTMEFDSLSRLFTDFYPSN